MEFKRVVITGTGVISPLGNNVASFISGIEEGRSAVVRMPGLEQYLGMRCLVAAPAELRDEKAIPRQNRRSMGRLSIFSAQAALQAVSEAGITEQMLSSGRLGCVIGSTMGSAESINEAFETLLSQKDISLLSGSKFFQCISNTAVMNVAEYLKITGYVLATCGACASSLQAIGAGFDLIRTGQQAIMLCGGAEGLHPTVVGSFDILFATSSGYNEKPSETPRPFDAKRDGLVCGEGAGIVVLEEYEHARRRGTKIYAEIVGYRTCGNGNHVSQSDQKTMILCINEALKSAKVLPSEIDYINAHATGTVQGDKEEASAIRDVFDDRVCVSSLKGYIGHTMGASGAIELIASLIMMQKGVIYPTRNLEQVADDCSGINHVLKPMKKEINIFLKNCFAFGGINAALVCKKVN